MKSSPPPPPMPAASGASGAARHAPSCRRSAPPSPPPRLSAPGLYSPLATTHPWLGFRAWLRRRVSGGPRFVLPSLLAEIRCPYTSPSLHILCWRCSWGTPWEFPIHHGRRCQGILQGDVKDAMDMQLLKVLSLLSSDIKL
ncbi:unnamed protein product [Triticum turgidum subsp. durum]|uniref:Uncharacterized protein n=1 Tax=Triticum turgidum subsp. durum TaxID=4567 RepID=A0A9R0TVG8_TRITD|nr:unnamed protein product [Triticum turgidum subsp. durum]